MRANSTQVILELFSTTLIANFHPVFLKIVAIDLLLKASNTPRSDIVKAHTLCPCDFRV